MTNETWKIVDKYPNYEISSTGRFRRNTKILKCNINKRGYLYCNVSIHGKVLKVKIHILVAQAFISNPYNYQTVNHKDGNKLNNNVNNLEWMTLKENIKHGYENNLMWNKH